MFIVGLIASNVTIIGCCFDLSVMFLSNNIRIVKENHSSILTKYNNIQKIKKSSSMDTMFTKNTLYKCKGIKR